jgi:hypothetical protein
VSEGVTTIVGIDPGLVHNGVVAVEFYPGLKQIEVKHAAIAGNQEPADISLAILQWVADEVGWPEVDQTYVESYRERGQAYATSPKMRAILAELRRDLPEAKILDNTGIKKVVRPKLLDLLGLRSFPTTHHQDLQSAARILVLGMLKDEELNALLADVVLAYISGTPWQVAHV